MIDVCFFTDEVSKSFDEAMKLGVAAGANAVEVRGGIWGKHVTAVSEDDVKRMQDVLAGCGAKVASIGSPFSKCYHDNQDEYEQHLRYFDRMVELTHAFDSHIIRGFAFWSPNRGTGADRPDIAPYLDMITEKLSRM